MHKHHKWHSTEPANGILESQTAKSTNRFKIKLAECWTPFHTAIFCFTFVNELQYKLWKAIETYGISQSVFKLPLWGSMQFLICYHNSFRRVVVENLHFHAHMFGLFLLFSTLVKIIAGDIFFNVLFLFKYFLMSFVNFTFYEQYHYFFSVLQTSHF